MCPKLQWLPIPPKIFCGVSVIIIVTISVLLTSADDNSGFAKSSENKVKINILTEDHHQELLTEHLTYPFEPSLEMRENVDFILTPALLVQENLSREIIVTYPGE